MQTYAAADRCSLDLALDRDGVAAAGMEVLRTCSGRRAADVAGAAHVAGAAGVEDVGRVEDVDLGLAEAVARLVDTLPDDSC